jgi:hypothetical protein
MAPPPVIALPLPLLPFEVTILLVALIQVMAVSSVFAIVPLVPVFAIPIVIAVVPMSLAMLVIVRPDNQRRG